MVDKPVLTEEYKRSLLSELNKIVKEAPQLYKALAEDKWC